MMGSLNQHAWNQSAFLDAARRMDRMGLDRRTRPTITKPQESIFQTGFHDRVLPLAPMARRLLPWILHAPVMTEQGPFCWLSIWRSKHAHIEHFHTSPGKHCPGPLLPNSKTYFGAGATRNPFQMDQGSTSGNGQRWMVLFERLDSFQSGTSTVPFVRRDWKSQRLGMGDRQDRLP